MTNRFEQNSKKTLFIIFIIIGAVFLIAFEKLIGISMGNTEEQVRHIRLREIPPMLDTSMKPNMNELKYTDSLSAKGFSFRTGPEGFLKPSFVHQYPDSTIAFIGGSTTECMYVSEEKRFPHLVAKLLTTNGKTVNGINSGVSGNDSLNSINIFLNKILPLQPDIAVLMHNINDLSLLMHEGSYWNQNPYRSPIVYEEKSAKRFIKSVFPNTYEFLFRIKSSLSGHIDEFAQHRDQKKPIKIDKILVAFEENLNVFIAISKAKNINPVLMTMANRFTDNPDKIISDKTKTLESIGVDYKTYKKWFDTMNERIREVASKHDILLIDLAKIVPQTKEYMVDSVHFNDLGSEFVAKHIAEKLNGLLPQ